MSNVTDVLIIGAGPAGLTAGYLLSKKKIPCVVLESDPDRVGGISRTVDYKGFRFDIGGHRFFSKSAEIEQLWTEILPQDLLTRRRYSRIYYRGKFYDYPLNPLQALWNLGFIEAFRCVLSYVGARLNPIRDVRSFEDWVSNQFGPRLFIIFFKTYTEKVWGMNCKDISADWAEQRIGRLSLGSAVLNALFRRSSGVKSLIGAFRYPRNGPGMLWRACADLMAANGGKVVMDAAVRRCRHDAATGIWTVEVENKSGEKSTYQAKQIISSAPLREMAEMLEPSPSSDALTAARRLRYRDFLVVGLVVKEKVPLRDQWLYIHDPSVKVGRVQNFKAWSPEMSTEPGYCAYGLEYFCFEGDGLWSTTDEDLKRLASKELVKIGLADPADIRDGMVIRQKKAYPVYDDDYGDNVDAVRRAFKSFPSLHMVGRNGMHKYNNQDHAMMTAMLTVENIVSGEDRFNPWNVNQDAVYIESGRAQSGLRAVPKARATDAG